MSTIDGMLNETTVAPQGDTVGNTEVLQGRFESWNVTGSLRDYASLSRAKRDVLEGRGLAIQASFGISPATMQQMLRQATGETDRKLPQYMLNVFNP